MATVTKRYLYLPHRTFSKLYDTRQRDEMQKDAVNDWFVMLPPSTDRPLTLEAKVDWMIGKRFCTPSPVGHCWCQHEHIEVSQPQVVAALLPHRGQRSHQPTGRLSPWRRQCMSCSTDRWCSLRYLTSGMRSKICYTLECEHIAGHFLHIDVCIDANVVVLGRHNHQKHVFSDPFLEEANFAAPHRSAQQWLLTFAAKPSVEFQCTFQRG